MLEKNLKFTKFILLLVVSLILLVGIADVFASATAEDAAAMQATAEAVAQHAWWY
jgi:hypothetical protein